MEAITARYTELLKNSATQLDTLRAKLAQMTDMRDNTPDDDKWLHDDQIAFAKMRYIRLEERIICYSSFLKDISNN